MLHARKRRLLIGVAVLATAVLLVAGLLLTADAAGLIWTPGLVITLCAAACTLLALVYAFRQRAKALAASQLLQSAREAAAAAAWRDPISGLALYRLFDAALHSAYERAQRYGNPFSVLLIEVSSLDSARTGMRTPAQERILRYLGGVVSANTRAADVTARLSESMFGIVLCETEQEGALVLWERLRGAAVAGWPEDRTWAISGGTAGYSVDVSSVESLMADADRRLAMEKRRLRAEPEP